MAELRGKLIVKKETNMVKQDFKVREFVIETEEQYPQKIPFQFVQEKCTLLDAFQVGQTVNVAFNFRGTQTDKDGETRYFLSLNAWKIN